MSSESVNVKVTERVRGELRRIMGELQQETTDRVTLGMTIAKLIDFWKKGGKNR